MINDWTARGVDQVRRWLHPTEFSLADQTSGLRHQGRTHGHEVTAPHQGLKVDKLRAELRHFRRGYEGIRGEEDHFERLD